MTQGVLKPLVVALSFTAGQASAQNEGAFELGTILLDGLVSETEGATEISEEQVEQDAATSLEEFFRSVPGVAGLSGPGRQFGDVNIRGVDGAGAVIVSVDGAEKNAVRRLHGVDFNPIFLNTPFIKGATVVKGPVSNVYGTGSIGGRIEFRTYDPEDFLLGGKTIGGQVEVGYEGNSSGYFLSAIGARQLSDTFSALLGLSYSEYGDYEDGNGVTVLNSGTEIGGVLAKLSFKPSDRFEGTLSYQHNSTNFIGANVFGNANNRQDVDIDNDVTDDTVTLSGTFFASDQLSFDGDIFYTVQDRRETTLAIRAGSTATVGDFLDSETETFGVSAYGTYLFDTGAASHKLQFGGSFTSNNLDYREQVGGTPTEQSGERTTFGIFIQDEIKIGSRWEIIPGLRWEGFDVDGDNGASVDGGELLPKLTVGFSPFDNGLQFYGSYARGLRSPRLNEVVAGGFTSSTRTRRGVTTTTNTTTLANPNLKPETSDNFEIGARFSNGPLAASVAVFHNEFQDRIEEVRLVDTTVGTTVTRVEQIQNVGEAWIQGIEVDVDYDVGRWFVGFNASATDGRNKQTGQNLNSIRPYSGVAYGGVRLFNQRMTLGTEIEWFDAKSEVGNNEVVGNASGGGTIFNIFGSYDIDDQWTFNARVNNITDEVYRKFDQIDLNPGLNAKFSVVARF